MSKGKMMMGALLAVAEAGNMMRGLDDKTPRPRMDVSKGTTLPGKEWRRRKKRNKMAKHSRRQNRK